ncbi:MAG: alkaline phosphatase D family protein [Pseudomonadota bacterium]
MTPRPDATSPHRRTRSLSQGMVDLGRKIAKEGSPVFDVVIVGSGYGGSIAAQQLAGLTTTDAATGLTRKITVCVLERGAEYLPGMFPSRFSELPTHVRYGVQGSGKIGGQAEGLFDVRVGGDVSALVANGLGGGSLINAGVLLKPDFNTFRSRLPAHVCAELDDVYLDAARQLLMGAPLSATNSSNTIQRSNLYGSEYPLKFHRLDELREGQGPGVTGAPAEICVAMKDQAASSTSVDLAACTGCGDCMTGCNVGAKASLDTNLLAQARHQGADIYTGASMLSLSQTHQAAGGNGAEPTWALQVVHTSPELRAREKDPLKLHARHVILAAGTLGSPEILLRSRSDSLALSNTLGEGFSCNGDNITAIHGLQRKACSTADEHVALHERKVGPTITNMVNVKGTAGGGAGFWIQEFSVPAALKRLFSELVTTGQTLAQLQTGDTGKHGGEARDAMDPCAVDDDAIDKTLLVGSIGHDDANGLLQLPLQSASAGQDSRQQGVLQIVWPQARDGRQLNAAQETLEKLCASAFPGASVIANPLWRLLPGKLGDLISQPLGPVLTVHPLGGCTMGANAGEGVVNEFGQVFNPRSLSADGVFETLAVLDGSIVAGSLGANPSLTISALALRAVAQLKKDWGFSSAPLQQTQALPPRPVFAAATPDTTTPPAPTVVEISERLWGHVSLQTAGDGQHPFLLELTMVYNQVPVRQLMSTWGGRRLTLDPARSFIRLYPSGEKDGVTGRFTSDAQRFLDDSARQALVAWQAPLSGSLRFLHRDASCQTQRTWRALGAYLLNRGGRDIWQKAAAWIDRQRHPEHRDPHEKKAGGSSLLSDALRLASRAGEARRFDYMLKIGQPVETPAHDAATLLDMALTGQFIRGEKRLTYNRRANPWEQLTTLRLTHMPLLAPGTNITLRVDAQFMARQAIPLLRIVGQHNHADALLDMASFGMYVARVLMNIHLWTFRKPDTPSQASSERLPGPIAGLPAPQVTLLTVGTQAKTGTPVQVRLTRYGQANAASGAAALPPVAMIHGYSVSGTTFTHPSLKPGAAEYFWRQGRDVWIIDLRTSSGVSTASLPWSIEEVALVDIPAALLHIKNVCGRQVDVIAHCIGAAMLSMAVLTDARRIRNSTTELGSDTWITPAQLATLTAFNGDGGSGIPHPTIRSIVLSQKGPLLRYTEANVFRAYIMGALRRWLVPGSYKFKVPAKPGVADQLLDRLLSSLPYPDADYDIENPLLPWKRTPWTASRHRMDALYARDFAAASLSSETLHAIDDLFGPINLDTVSQTIHFVRFSCVTNQRGRGEFVSLDNLRLRWSGIPTLAIHGAQNGLVDVSTQDLLEANFTAAGVPFQRKTYGDMEHQDVWIGTRSTTAFRDIEAFLRQPARHAAVLPAGEAWHFEQPWIGPRMKREGDVVAVHALSSPKFGTGRLLLVPVGSPASPRCAPVLISEPCTSRDWARISFSRNWSDDDAGVAGWLAIMAYPRGQTTLQDAEAVAAPGVAGIDDSSLQHALETELDSWLEQRTDLREACFVDRRDIDRQRHLSPVEFSFALGSCQCPPGMLDHGPAAASLDAMANLRNAADQLAPDFAIFAGDQIYADATAGLADPKRSDERFDVPYETALRTAPMRRIMRDIPAYMLPDDHEFVDNWEPSWGGHRVSSGELGLLRLQGLKAYWKYQRMEAVGPGRYPAMPPVSFNFQHGCADFYMLDTRSGRRYRKPGDTSTPAMLRADELDCLKDWLVRSTSLVKFIVSPSIVLPRRLGALNSGADHAARTDAWEGYPADLNALLTFIAEQQCHNIVFLSGDEHLSCVASATLSMTQPQAGRGPVRIASIHSSGLYAPFPFANARAEDFIGGVDRFTTGELACASAVRFNPPGSAFAVINVSANHGQPKVSVTFTVAGQRHQYDDVFSLAPSAMPFAEGAGHAMPIAAAL